MVNFECTKCGHKDSIEWGINGYSLVDMTLNFHCRKCGNPGTLVITFPTKDTKKKVEVSFDNASYIG